MRDLPVRPLNGARAVPTTQELSNKQLFYRACLKDVFRSIVLGVVVGMNTTMALACDEPEFPTRLFVVMTTIAFLIALVLALFTNGLKHLEKERENTDKKVGERDSQITRLSDKLAMTENECKRLRSRSLPESYFSYVVDRDTGVRHELNGNCAAYSLVIFELVDDGRQLQRGKIAQFDPGDVAELGLTLTDGLWLDYVYSFGSDTFRFTARTKDGRTSISFNELFSGETFRLGDFIVVVHRALPPALKVLHQHDIQPIKCAEQLIERAARTTGVSHSDVAV